MYNDLGVKGKTFTPEKERIMAQGELEKKIELNWLSAFYGGLLTPSSGT